MKFSCTQENLNQGLSVVSHVASKNINLPILSNVLIKAENSSIRFMSTNLEIAINCLVRGKVEEPGEFTVPSKLFSDYVSLLPKDRVDVGTEGNTLSVGCGSYQTKMNGIHASEFPLIPSIEEKYIFKLNVAELRKAIGQVLFAVAPNESRPEISGVLFRFHEEKDGIALTLAGTDSYRLAERTIKVSGEGSSKLTESVSVIVPARTVAEVVRIIGVFKDTIDNPTVMDIRIGESQVSFVYNSAEIISRIIEGRYPDYRQLIPERFETEVQVEKDELLRAVRTTSLFSRTGLNDCRFDLKPEQPIHLSSVNAQTGQHAVDLDGAVIGKPNTITVNFKYFLDGVSNVESDGVTLQLIDSVSPCLIRPVKGHDTTRSDEYLYIVMPIRQ